MASKTSSTTDVVDTPVDQVPAAEVDEKAAAAAAVTDAQSDNTSDLVRDFPWQWKAIALCSGIALSWGSSFSENTLGPLKSTLKTELDIDNVKYGALGSATSLVNTVLPIIGGYGLDYYGVEWGSLVCSVAIFVGAVISASGSNQDTFGLVLGGRVVMGFGSTVIETCTSKILAHWFQHRGLGLVYGLDLAVGKLIVLLAKATAVPMRDASSFWGWALWIPAIVCFVNLLQNIHYVWWARSRPEWAQMMTTSKRRAIEAQEAQELANPGGEHAVLKTPGFGGFLTALYKICFHIPRMFWLVLVTQILQAGVVGGFNGLNADIISVTRGSTAQIAGYTSAVQQVIPVICAPLLGTFFDFFGRRMFFVSLTSAVWILVYCLIGLTKVHALVGMIIASFGSTMNALPFLVSIPLLVPNQEELGLVFGFWKASNNCGSVIVDMIAGRLQDITPNQTYERVIIFFVCLKGLEFCLGLFYGILDRKYLGGILTMSEKKRLVMEKQGKLEDLPGRRPSKKMTYTGLFTLFCLVVIAWVLFIKYSL